MPTDLEALVLAVTATSKQVVSETDSGNTGVEKRTGLDGKQYPAAPVDAEKTHRILVRRADGSFETVAVTAAEAVAYCNGAGVWRRIR